MQLQGGAVGNNDSVQTIDSIMSVDETLPKRRAEGVSAPVAAASAANRSEDGLSLVSSSLSTGSSLEELTELEDEDVDESMEVFESVSNDGNVESDGGSSEAPSMTPSEVLRSTPFQSLKEKFDH